jgi:hypothetical protein
MSRRKRWPDRFPAITKQDGIEVIKAIQQVSKAVDTGNETAVRAALVKFVAFMAGLLRRDPAWAAAGAAVIDEGAHQWALDYYKRTMAIWPEVEKVLNRQDAERN